MEKDIRLSFRYSEDEYVEAVQMYYFKNNVLRIYILAASILACFGLYYLFINIHPLLGLILVILGVFIYAVSIYIIMINPRKFYKSQPLLKAELYFTFMEDGVLFQLKDDIKELNWDYYSNYIENKKYIYLIYGKKLFTIIPKRAINNDTKIKKLKVLLENNIRKI